MIKQQNILKCYNSTEKKYLKPVQKIKDLKRTLKA